METDEDHATMRESLSLVQNIGPISIDYTVIFLLKTYTDWTPIHIKDDTVE